MANAKHAAAITFVLLQAIAIPGRAGSLVPWGADGHGQVSNTPQGADFTAVSVGDLHSVALRSDGSLAAWGVENGSVYDYGQIRETPVGYDFIAVSAGSYHNVALKANGTLIAWGYAGDGRISNTPTGSDWVSVSAGAYGSLALNSDGSLTAWGQDNYGQVSNTPEGNDFVAISAGDFHNLALKANGSIVAWGADGVIGSVPVGNDFIAIAAGYYHSVALRTDGSIVTWGYDFHNQVSNSPTGNDFTAIAAGGHHGVALRSNGSLVTWGSDDYGVVSDTPEGNNLAGVAVGWYHAVAITSSAKGVPVYRFWSPVNSRHFYTISETERQKLINTYSHVWTYEGVAYRAFATASEVGLVPVYRFWSEVLGGHFYTTNTAERDKLIDNYSDVWTYEGSAFYAYPEGLAPAEASPVYRFWSDTLGGHFYTINETERDKLINTYSHVWAYEGIAWYAYAVD